MPVTSSGSKLIPASFFGMPLGLRRKPESTTPILYVPNMAGSVIFAGAATAMGHPEIGYGLSQAFTISHFVRGRLLPGAVTAERSFVGPHPFTTPPYRGG